LDAGGLSLPHKASCVLLQGQLTKIIIFVRWSGITTIISPNLFSALPLFINQRIVALVYLTDL